MEAELRQKINEIVGPMYCPEDYYCVDAGFEGLRKARTDDQGTFLVCLRPNPVGCAPAVPRSGVHECRCVLRACLSQKLYRPIL